MRKIHGQKYSVWQKCDKKLNKLTHSWFFAICTERAVQLEDVERDSVKMSKSRVQSSERPGPDRFGSAQLRQLTSSLKPKVPMADCSRDLSPETSFPRHSSACAYRCLHVQDKNYIPPQCGRASGKKS